jgi:hypothetical protein
MLAFYVAYCHTSKLEAFLAGLHVRPVYVGTVYDPTFGDDSRNFLAVRPASHAPTIAA